jgi:hypothetical protein
MIIGKENANTSDQSLKVKGAILNILLNIGEYKIIECNPRELNKKKYDKQARISRGLLNRPTLRILESSERALSALSISIITSTDKLRVEALALP